MNKSNNKSTQINPLVLKQFIESQKHLKKFGGLPNLDNASEIWDEIWLVEAHNSTGLEGNTLPLSEVRALLDYHKTSGSKKLKEFLEVLGYANAAKWVYTQARTPHMHSVTDDLVTLTEIRYMHEELIRLVWQIDPPLQLTPDEGPGSFRKHNIKRFEEGMKPPDFTQVPELINSWLTETNSAMIGVHQPEDVPEQLAIVHSKYEQIHPFRDGNGRTGRLIINLILIRLGYPPCIILKTRRKQYLNAMQLADSGNYKKLSEIIARGVIDNIHRFIVPQSMTKSDLVDLESLVNKNYTYAALRQAALRGRLEATIGPDGRYYSTKQALQEYDLSRYKR